MLSSQLNSELVKLISELTITVRKWRRVHLPPLRPLPIVFTLISERENPGMPDILTYKVSIPAANDPDVVKQVFSVSLVGDDGSLTPAFGPKEYGRGAAEESVDVPQDSNILSTLVAVDDSGNETPLEQRFVAKDTIKPAAPGQVGFELVSEQEGDNA